LRERATDNITLCGVRAFYKLGNEMLIKGCGGRVVVGSTTGFELPVLSN
jgi:hypothetical protein